MDAIHRRRMLSVLAGLPGVAAWARAEEPDPRLVEIDLCARHNWRRLGSADAYLDTYNGLLPGPAIDARPGDRIRLQFRNELSEPTNLHFHGLHVSPEGRADNAMLSIPSGEQFLYELDLSSDHPASLFWYHPHLHGLAARQLSRGLAGLFVVRGELDAIPEIAAAPEQFVMLQDFAIDRAGLPVEPGAMEKVTGREGNLVTVNGELQPTIAIARSGWVRLRMLNASSSRFYRLAIEEHPLHVIGTDGGALAGPVEYAEVLLAPGERIDAMVHGSRPAGRYRLLNLPYRRAEGMSASPRSETLATLEYEGQADRSWPLPERLLNVEPLPAPARRRTFSLGGGGMGMGAMAGPGGMNFTINGRAFDPERTDTLARLGDVEDWVFVNPTGMDHPMHVHTNPFQVVGAAGLPEPAWKDVVIVPARSTVTWRTRFRDFPGRTMYHCHILDHEDLGMMATLEIAGA